MQTQLLTLEERIAKAVCSHTKEIDLLSAMWHDRCIAFYDEEIVNDPAVPSIFLAGTTSRNGIPSYMWRKDVVWELRSRGYMGRIFIPEYRGESFATRGAHPRDFTDENKIYRWERTGLRAATAIVFWIPRDRGELLALTTNRELGQWIGKAEHDESINERLFIGWPPEAVNMGSVGYEIEESKIGALKGGHFNTLEELCATVVRYLKSKRMK